MLEYICKERAYRYYFPEYHGKCKPGWLLHHKDPLWKINDPERYHQWNIEDLIPMTFSEHTKWHAENDPEWINSKKTEITKERMRFSHLGEKNYNYGKHFSKSHRKKIGDAKLGERNPNYGKHLSKEEKDHLRETSKNAMTDERRNKIGDFFKKLHWYSNGEICIRAKECPEGFFPGRMKKC